MFGGLLAVLLTCFTQDKVIAADTGLSLNSQGVLKFTDGAGKQIVFDSADLYALKGAVEGVSMPKLKVTYHAHTDSCYFTTFRYIKNGTSYYSRWVLGTFYVAVHGNNAYDGATTISASKDYDMYCSTCSTKVFDCVPGSNAIVFTSKAHNGWVYYYLRVSTGTESRTTVTVCPHVNISIPEVDNYLRSHNDTVVLGDDILICGKDETTIESVELVE